PNADEDEKPAHRVLLNPYQLGRYEVSVAQYMTFVEKTGRNLPEWLDSTSTAWIFDGRNDFYLPLGNAIYQPTHPIVGISWSDAQAYSKWLGDAYRLPTEAEWEYAARGGQDFLFAGSDELNSVAWYNENANGKIHAVGQKVANGYGLFDMSGNVFEWCQDWYDENYYTQQAAKQGSTLNPSGPATGNNRVGRGGSWYESEENCRISFRDQAVQDGRGVDVGFRVARTIPTVQK
ncbi:MAG: formylglycine-generating enzyme family protein, partial [Bacteroidota bacterium]